MKINSFSPSDPNTQRPGAFLVSFQH